MEGNILRPLVFSCPPSSYFPDNDGIILKDFLQEIHRWKFINEGLRIAAQMPYPLVRISPGLTD